MTESPPYPAVNQPLLDLLNYGRFGSPVRVGPCVRQQVVSSEAVFYEFLIDGPCVSAVRWFIDIGFVFEIVDTFGLMLRIRPWSARCGITKLDGRLTLSIYDYSTGVLRGGT